ncbi:MAG: hypothetical protein PHY92_00135 [Alphaproteobacteria bacterium]|nr:hypothetical protein [Alphaproteobacteria bacterium]
MNKSKEEKTPTQTEYMQRLWKRYESEHDNLPTSAREVVEWAVKQRLIGMPVIDPFDVLAGQMSRALRGDYDIDSQGRRYRKNHAVKVMKDGVQYTLWASMEHAPRPHMAKAFSQRREQIIGDCFQLKTDVDVYNGKNLEQPPIQLELNFTDDVAEREIALYSDDDDQEAI